MSRVGIVYLLCFRDPDTNEHARFGHAGHYMGWTLDPETRLMDHADGRGAALLRAVKNAGLTWKIVRTWKGDRRLEYRLKALGGHARKCPFCNPDSPWGQFTDGGEYHSAYEFSRRRRRRRKKAKYGRKSKVKGGEARRPHRRR
jgi:predicted GIY-YIG superfamily endonuclease